jgi:hypothetical protein
MSEFSLFEVREKLERLGEKRLLEEIPTYNRAAQRFYYEALIKIEHDKREDEKIELQREANKISCATKNRATWALAISIIACIISAAATIATAYLNK